MIKNRENLLYFFFVRSWIYFVKCVLEKCVFFFLLIVIFVVVFSRVDCLLNNYNIREFLIKYNFSLGGYGIFCFKE